MIAAQQSTSDVQSNIHGATTVCSSLDTLSSSLLTTCKSTPQSLAETSEIDQDAAKLNNPDAGAEPVSPARRVILSASKPLSKRKKKSRIGKTPAEKINWTEAEVSVHFDSPLILFPIGHRASPPCQDIRRTVVA